MKIDDLFGRAFVAGSNKMEKSKAVTKPKSATSANSPTILDKTVGEKKPSNSPNTTGARADTYHPQPNAVLPPANTERQSPPIRKDRVERARQLMAAGEYDSPEIVNKIIDRLIEAIREA